MSENLPIELEEELEGEEEVDFHGPEMKHPFDPKQINIKVEVKSLDSLIERMRHDEIDMNTDFQRHADLWKPKEMSRLIESILIRFPLPAFYFDATNEDKWLIVDGLQRLSSIRRFIIDENKLRLCGMEFLQDLNGKTYDELSRTYKRRFNECQVTTYLIQPGTPSKVKYSVFERINTGGLFLRKQEIRNAMAAERERRFLEELSKNINMQNTMGDQSKRMVDQELALRFLAFYQKDYLVSKKDIADFLNETMEELKGRTDQQLLMLKKIFNDAIFRCFEIFGKNAFEKRSNGDTKRIRKSSTLFEVWMVCMARLTDAQAEVLIEKKQTVVEKSKALIHDNEFRNAITYSTQKREHVRIRYQKVEQLIEEVLGA